MKDDEINLDEARRLAEAQLSAPWVVHPTKDGYLVLDGNSMWTADVGPDETSAAFIAAARTLVPQLIAECERLGRERDEAVADMERMRTVRSAADEGQIQTMIVRCAKLIAERDAVASVYGIAASLRTHPVPFDDHMRLVDAVDRARAALESDDA